MRAVLGIHEYAGADGAPVRRRAAFRVGLKGNVLLGVDDVPEPADATLAVTCTAAVREVSLPFADPRKAAQVVSFELDGKTPYDVDGSVVSHELLATTRDGSRFLAAVAPEERIAQTIAAHGGGDRPQVILPEAVALYYFARAVGAGRAEPMLLLDVRPGRVLMVQVAGGRWSGTRSANLAWRPGETLDGQAVATLRRTAQSLLLAAGAAPREALVVGDAGPDGARFAEALGLPAVDVAALGGQRPEWLARLDGGQLAVSAVAIGLALAAVDGKRRLNLRGGTFTLAEAAEGVVLKRVASVGMGLLLLLGLAWGDAWVRHRVADTAFQNAKAALDGRFKAAFPEVGRVVNPVKQAQTELKRLSARALLYGSSGTTPLGYLEAISRAIPRELTIDVFEFSVEGTRLRMEAEALSFDAIDQIKAQIAGIPGITDVRVSDAKMNAGQNRVKFRVSATLAEGV
ncbi:MAG: hypothetical protein HZA24_00695 [Nitrospirae bacterium]|nr:hypothetical protein [Nitrospirota bacterium]